MIIHRVSKNESTEFFRKRHIVFLSEKGIETICDSAMKRAKNAIDDFAIDLQDYKDIKLQIIGTAGLRTASNGPELASYIENRLGVKVDVIDGKREAELIAKGVLYSLQKISNGLVVDIGGGSVEFIHIVDNSIQWINSYPIGIGVLHNHFQHGEPISKPEIKTIKSYIDSHTQDLRDYLQDKAVNQLIGASGSFELLPKLIWQEPEFDQIATSISIEEFYIIRDKIWSKSEEERRKIPYLPEMRVKLSVISFIIMDWVCEITDVDKIYISQFAVKEGVIAEALSSIQQQ